MTRAAQTSSRDGERNTHKHVDHDQSERDHDDEVEAATALWSVAEREDEAAD